MGSVWSASAGMPRFPSLHGDVSTDVLVIGGGLAGLLTAYFLQQNGVRTVLAEQDRICSGVTANTTAKITFQHGLIYQDIVRRSGVEAAQKYLRANAAALDEYARLCRDIDCDFEYKDNFIYSVHDRGKLEKEMLALERIGYAAELCDELPVPVQTVGAVRFPRQAQFHPLKFAGRIAEGLNIHELTPVTEMLGNTAVTPNGKIHAGRVICCTHFPFINKHGSYFIKLYQDRSYVIALENAQNVDGMYRDEYETGLSFRNAGELLLIGGGSHRTGKKGGSWDELRDFAAHVYPEAREKYHWATQDCMSLDSIPYIGHYSARTPDFFVATGFNKWGMTSSMAAAQILTGEIIGQPREYADVFEPSRSILRPQLAVNGFETAVNFLTPTKKRCPHLGCALKWNKAEHSWDCPCHGSRFTEDGRLLNNPATGDLPER